MTEVGAYGIVKSKRGEGSRVPTDVSRLLDEIEVRGFGAVPTVLSGQEVDRLNLVMDQLYERQCAEVGGEAALQLMNDADIVRCMLASSQDYMDLATHPILLEVARAILGENFVLLMQNGVINRPERRQFQTNWHRDLNYQHWVCSRPIAISMLVCLEDFSQETGGTAFLPASHMFADFPAAHLVTGSEVTPTLPRGSFIFFNSMTFHRAGVNTSGVIRRAVNHVLGAPILAQQVDIPSMLAREPPADPWLAGYLGYRWNPTRDVAAWRRQRIADAEAKRATSSLG